MADFKFRKVPWVVITGKTENSVGMLWDAVPNATSYNIYRNGVLRTTRTATLYPGQEVWTDTGLLSNTTYTYAAAAVIGTRVGTIGKAATVTTNPPPNVDASPPVWSSAPSLVATALSAYTIQLDCVVATDNVGVTRYRFERSLDGLTGWVTVQDNSTSRTCVDSGRSPNTQYFYRVSALDAAGNQSAYATANATTQAAATGTTYWLHNPANGLVSTVPSATHGLFSDSIVTTVDGRAAIRTTVNDVQGNRGLELLVNHIPTGAPFGRSLFFRFWLKFDAGYVLGTTGERKWKIGRVGNPAGCCTFYYWPDKWQMSELGDGFAQDIYDKTVAANNNPQSDTTLRNWNEFIFEVQYPTSSAVKNDSIFRVYRNGSLIGESSESQWFTLNNDHTTQWGGVMSRVYPQLNSDGTGGGYIYVGETSITDYFYSTV